MRNHRYHGLFGAVIIEPPGAEWYRNFSRKKDSFAEQAVITAPGTESFREYVLFIQNGIRLLDAEGNLIQTAAEDNGEPVDAKDIIIVRNVLPTGLREIPELGRYLAAKCMEIRPLRSGKHILGTG